MALFKIERGNEGDLPAAKTDGHAYFTTDHGNFYIDFVYFDENTSQEVRRRTQINAMYAEGLRKAIRDEDGLITSYEDPIDVSKFITEDRVNDELSLESTEPVQNKVITEKFNAVDENLEELSKAVEIGTAKAYFATLSADNWGETSPWQQTIELEGLRANLPPLITYVDTNNAITNESYATAFRYLTYVDADPETQSITAVCNTSLPNIDIPIVIIDIG